MFVHKEACYSHKFANIEIDIERSLTYPLQRNRQKDAGNTMLMNYKRCYMTGLRLIKSSSFDIDLVQHIRSLLVET